MTAMKHKDFQPCAVCGKGVLHNNIITFYRLKLDYMVAHLPAIERQQGLEMMLGNPVIAHVMGPDEDLAKALSQEAFLLCFDCAMRDPVAALMEIIADKKGAADQVANHG